MMASRELWQTLLEKSPQDSIYEGVDSQGRFLLPTNFSNNLASDSLNLANPLTERYLVALALTEVCCHIGKGKVYYLPMEDGLTQIKNLSFKEQNEYASVFHRLPKLIYVPFVWGEEDQKTWLQIQHEDRLRLLNARAGGVSREECVMPMDLIYETLEKNHVELNAYNSEHIGCKACLVIVPKAYLGWCNALQKNHCGLEFTEAGWEDGAGAYFVANNTTLEYYQAQDGPAVIDRLWKMYFAGEPRSLIKFKDILEAVIPFYDFQSDHDVL